MEFTVSARTLAREVAWVARMLPRTPSMPVLAGIRLQASQGELRLSVFDYEVCAHTDLDADVTEAGVCVVPGRTLAAVADQLPTTDAQVSVDTAALSIDAGGARFRLLSLPVEDYPTTPDLPDPLGEIDAETFRAAVTQTAVAASTEPAFPALTGIHLRLSADTLALQATDRYRAVRRSLPWQAHEPEESVLVPARTLTHAAKTMTGRLTLALQHEGEETQAYGLALSDGHRSLITRLLDVESSPPLDRTLAQITAADPTVALTDTAALLAAVRRAAAVTTREVPIVLQTSATQIRVHGGTHGADSGADTIAADVDGEATAGSTPAYLVDALTTINTDQLRLTITGNKHMLLTPADTETAGLYQHMIARRLT